MKRLAIVLSLVSVFAFADDPEIRSALRKSYLLSDSEVAQIKKEIRTRCHLPQGDEVTYPWYYHYELGLAMKNRKDWQRALDSFLVALDEREKPERSSRIYGMWFVDYFPYYNIGLAHYHLQNWKCAMNSFRLSEIYEDTGSKERIRMQEYEAQAEENLSE